MEMSQLEQQSRPLFLTLRHSDSLAVGGKGEAADRRAGQTQDKAVTLLRQDPAMQKAFIDMVAGPIVNKMFECAMIP
jgi:hypothetical protein